jgi:hypothetical protein
MQDLVEGVWIEIKLFWGDVFEREDLKRGDGEVVQ